MREIINGSPVVQSYEDTSPPVFNGPLLKNNNNLVSGGCDSCGCNNKSKLRKSKLRKSKRN